MALIPPFFLDCVVALGTKTPEARMHWVGTGLLYGQLIKQHAEHQREYAVFLVTNRHVLKDLKNLWVRFNSLEGQPCRDLEAALYAGSGEPIWHTHGDEAVDVGVLRLNYDVLIQNQVDLSFFRSDEHALPIAALKAEGVTEGDGVFVLGFPMGIVTDRRQCVICRTGCIARIRDLLEGFGADFLVDSTVFPGNSGGPVILRPDATSIAGTKSLQRACLIGLVKSYVPYQDIALSAQTKRPRVIFEENSGLTAVVPFDRVLEVIAQALALPAPAPTPA